MDYHPERNTSLAVSKTPSFVYNNLTCNGTTVAYAHREEIVTFSESTASGGQLPKETVLRPQLAPAKVLQVRFCHLGGRDYLAVGTGSGFAVYDGAAKTCLFIFELTAADVPFPDADAAFVRGIAAVPGVGHIVAGSSSGHLFAFAVGDEGTVERTKTIPPTRDDAGTGTSAVDAAGAWVAVGSDSGSLSLLEASSDYAVRARFTHAVSCTCVAVAGDYAVAGYATGMLRVVRLSSGSVYAEIGAHSRSVMALDVHPERPRFASVGEDSVLTVWDLPTAEESKADEQAEMHVAFTTLVKDAVLVGVQFSRNGSNNLMMASYDQRRVRFYAAA